MKAMTHTPSIPAVLVACVLAFPVVSSLPVAAAPKGKQAIPAAELTVAGKALEARYAGLQQALKTEIEAALPRQNDAKTAARLDAVQAEDAAAKHASATAGEVRQLEKEVQSLEQLEEKAKQPLQTFAEAQDEMREILEKGESNPKLAELLKSESVFQAHIQNERDQLSGKIEKARKKASEAKAALPSAIQAAEAAEQACQEAMAQTWQAMDALGMDGILGSDALDGKLARYLVITEATPRGLAEFAEKSPAHEQLVDQLLADEGLMVQMLLADGPNGGKYGEAMQIYADIQKASAKAKDGIFQRLALAVSLGHSVPIQKRGPTATDTTEWIDPVQRYLSYEKWYSEGELHPGFKDLSVWNLVMAVDGSDPDEVYAWGRQMLRAFRPDCIPTDGDPSVYVKVVDKEIAYTSANVNRDLPEMHFMQNILANGGVCGRRAFFGRFTLRAFGVPATGRKQPGHATLAHWHPDGWQTRLGGNWGLGARGNYSSMSRTRSAPYGVDLNFLASSQAREDEAAFMRVKRAQWIGAVTGEAPKPGFIVLSSGSKNKKQVSEPKPIFWNELALHEQKRIITKLEASKKPSSGTASAVAKASGPTGKVSIDARRVITIPSAACSSPVENTWLQMKSGPRNLIVFMQAPSGEPRLHLSRYSRAADSFEYTFDAPKAGTYQLVATIATANPSQSIFASANRAPAVEIELPYTVGLWEKTAPVAIELKAGPNVLTFRGPARVTFDQVVLTPTN